MLLNKLLDGLVAQSEKLPEKDIQFITNLATNLNHHIGANPKDHKEVEIFDELLNTGEYMILREITHKIMVIMELDLVIEGMNQDASGEHDYDEIE